MARLAESDLYRPVKAFLEESDNQVFAEVAPYPSGKRADVVGLHGKIITVVELKTTLSLDLIDQAYHWRKHAHYIYVAVPKRIKPFSQMIRYYLSKERIGIIEVSDDFYEGYRVLEPARFNRPYEPLDWQSILLPQHQTWVEGGSAVGGHVTPYKLTIEAVKKYLHGERYKWASQQSGDDGWRSIQQILDHCETHYRSPKPSLSATLRGNINEWCESKQEAGLLYFRHE